MTLQEFFTQGGSVCPFAEKCNIRFVEDKHDFTPTFRKMKLGDAAVIVCTGTLDVGNKFQETKFWALEHFLKAMLTAAEITFPEASRTTLRNLVTRQVLACLDENNPIRYHINLHGFSLITICMSPCYRETHPRYAPQTCLVLTWQHDVAMVGALPKVREAMLREHGFLYDGIHER